MKTRAINLWQRLLSTFWFAPSLMALGGFLLGGAMVVVDKRLGVPLLETRSWFYLSEPDGVREVLSTIAGSMITVTGVVFSIMVVALSLASQQFGPRLLSNFMRDRGNQVVFGTVIATYIYCLLVLRSVSNGFVPHLAEVGGLLLAMASLVALIYFIHHTAESIQAVKIINRVSDDLECAVDRLFPPKDPVAFPIDPGDVPDFDRTGCLVVAQRKGFLQAVAIEGLLEFAARAEIVVRVERRPGHFIVPGTALVSVWPVQQGSRNDLDRHLHGFFIIGRQRTLEQDADFLIDELVEMAVRSLSPGINDPFTAMSCIDHLSVALVRIAGRGLPTIYHHDDRQRLRVITWPTSFGNLVDAAFDQIRQNGAHHATVYIRLLEGIGRVVAMCEEKEQYGPLLDQARLVLAAARRSLPAAADRLDVESRWKELVATAERRFSIEVKVAGQD